MGRWVGGQGNGDGGDGGALSFQCAEIVASSVQIWAGTRVAVKCGGVRWCGVCGVGGGGDGVQIQPSSAPKNLVVFTWVFEYHNSFYKQTGGGHYMSMIHTHNIQ